MNKINNAIRKALHKQGVTGFEIEKKLGINHSVISRMLQGRDIRCDTASKIMNYLDIQVKEKD